MRDQQLTPLNLIRQADSFLFEGKQNEFFGGNLNRDLHRVRGGTFDQRHMEDEKEGTVCSECGRTVTHGEYSSGQPTCCKGGDVIPQEEYGRNHREDCGKPKRHKDGRTYDNKEDMAEELINQFQSTGHVIVQELAGDNLLRALGDEDGRRKSGPSPAMKVDNRELGKQGIYPGDYNPKVGEHVDFYDSNGDKQYGRVVHNDGMHIHFDVKGTLHKQMFQWKPESYRRTESVNELHHDPVMAGLDGNSRIMKFHGFTQLGEFWVHPDGDKFSRTVVDSANPKALDRSMRARSLDSGLGASYFESVAPGYIQSTNGNNSGRPDGRHASDHPAPAGEALQDLHRRLGSALPELHALAVSTITDERSALGMLFNELHTAHCDMGNALSYVNQIPDLEMSEIAQHYSRVVSDMIGALNPYMTKNPAVASGPYHLGGTLHDSISEARSLATAWLGPFNDISEMLVKYQSFVRGASSEDQKADIPRLQEACSLLIDDQSWYQPRRSSATDTDWSYGKGKPMASGQPVKVNLPGHAMHGMTGKIVRQQSNQFAVEVPHRPGKVEFFSANQLENA